MTKKKRSEAHERHLPLFVEPSVFDVYFGGPNQVIAPNQILVKDAKFTKRIAWNVCLLEHWKQNSARIGKTNQNCNFKSGCNSVHELSLLHPLKKVDTTHLKFIGAVEFRVQSFFSQAVYNVNEIFSRAPHNIVPFLVNNCRCKARAMFQHQIRIR